MGQGIRYVRSALSRCGMRCMRGVVGMRGDAGIRLYLAGPHPACVVAKATKASYAMGSVLHNRRLDTEIRRIVLMAKLRPVVEYGSTVWHAASAPEQNQIEAVIINFCLRLPG